MPYVKDLDRNQLIMTSLDSRVVSYSTARIIDAFVDSLDLEELGFARIRPSFEGRPSYNPRALLKLYIYGYQNNITTSRKLAKACTVNLEVIWLVKGVTPDFRTISEFRKRNVGCMKKVFRAFNRLLKEEVETGFQSVDGSKFIANNSRENNFTASKLDDRIAWLEGHIAEYLRLLELSDTETAKVLEGLSKDGSVSENGGFSKEEAEGKLLEAEDRRALYKKYRKHMEEENLSQLSTTDPEARLMKTRNGFNVSYNIETSVSSESHLISGFIVTNSVTDYGQLHPTLSEVKKERPDEIIESVSDQGFQSEADMRACLEDGIIPHVILPDGKDTYELFFPYEPAEQCDPSSTKSEELRKCLRSGVIPEAYREYLESATIVERSIPEDADPNENPSSPFKDDQEMREKAEEGYFVRDAERNIVYCPAGKILRQAYVNKQDRIRYVNKMACRNCPHRDRCTRSKKGFREVDFNKDEFCKSNGIWLKSIGEKPVFTKNRKPKVIRQFVAIVFRPDRRKMAERQCLSEHPFGTIKHALGVRYLLLRGKPKVEGEFSLLALGYNMIRSINLIGFDELMRRITASFRALYSIFMVHLQNGLYYCNISVNIC